MKLVSERLRLIHFHRHESECLGQLLKKWSGDWMAERINCFQRNVTDVALSDALVEDDEFFQLRGKQKPEVGVWPKHHRREVCEP